MVGLPLSGLIQPDLHAISLADDDGNSISFGVRLQSRLEFNQGVNDVNGDPATDQSGVDTIDLYLRRLRLYVKGRQPGSSHLCFTFGPIPWAPPAKRLPTTQKMILQNLSGIR